MQPTYLKTKEQALNALEKGGKINYLSSNGESVIWGTNSGMYATNVRNVRVGNENGSRTIGSETGIGAFPIMTPGLTERKSESSYRKGFSH